MVIPNVLRLTLKDDTTDVAIKDLEALEKYMHDPEHLAGDDVILPRVARLSAVRFAADDDPDIGAKVFALHQAKVAKYPEWGRLVESIAVA
jgi:hypothetical protein